MPRPLECPAPLPGRCPSESSLARQVTVCVCGVQHGRGRAAALRLGRLRGPRLQVRLCVCVCVCVLAAVRVPVRLSKGCLSAAVLLSPSCLSESSIRGPQLSCVCECSPSSECLYSCPKGASLSRSHPVRVVCLSHLSESPVRVVFSTVAFLTSPVCPSRSPLSDSIIRVFQRAWAAVHSVN